MKLLPLLVLTIVAPAASALTLEEYLAQVQTRHHGLKALTESRSAAESRREAGDIELSPVLTAQAQAIDDKKPQSLGTVTTERTQAQQYSLGLGKKFSSGTQAQVTASSGQAIVDGSVLSPPSTFSTTQGTGSLGVSLSQSLWKDGFGRSTDLRRARQLAIESTEKQSYDLQARQIMIEAESQYWDYLYEKQETQQRRESLERARRIESWVKRRVGNGIGDQADLYNAQGLVAGRELQLLMAQDELTAAEKKIRDALELGENEPLPELTGDLGASRSLEQMSSGTGRGRRVRLDSWLAVLDAKTKAIVADEVQEGYRPDLVLSGAYNTNAVESSWARANERISNTDTPTTVVGLKLTWMLDGDLKDAARSTARSEALAARLKKERQLLESESAWREMNRRHQELAKKIRAAEISADVQNKKAIAQRDKLSKGRSITSDVITAEQDAAESLLTLTKLRAEQRKLEAQGRLFVTMEEVP